MQAIIILAHKNIKQVAALAQLLSSKFNVYIHIDQKYRLSEDEKSLLTIKNTRYYQIMKVNWSAWSICEATHFLLQEALKDPENHYFHLISGQDWPALPTDQLYQFYENTDKIYMRYAPAKNAVKSGQNLLRWQQYYYYYDRIPRQSFCGKVYHHAAMALQSLFRVDKLKRYGIDITLYQGSEWMDLPRDAVEYLLDYFNLHEELRKLFCTGYCSDEFWIQTILCNSPFLSRIDQNDHRYIVWKWRHESYPAILDSSDYQTIQDGDYHFMRKVDAQISAELIKNYQ